MVKFHFIMAILAACRLTEVIGVDTIFAPVRSLFSNRKWLQMLWTCPKCVSIWAGLISTLAFVYFPYFNWPFALSFAFLISGRWLMPVGMDQSRMQSMLMQMEKYKSHRPEPK